MMDKPVFDAASFVDIDLSTGEISTPVNDRLTLVPAEVLKALQPGEPLMTASTAWGFMHGQRLAAHLKENAAEIGMEELASFLSGTVAALGMGTLSIEIRRDALIFRTKGETDKTEGETELIAGFLSGYLSALGDNAFGVLHMGEQEGDQLYFAGNPDIVDEVSQVPKQGQARFEAIEKLTAGSQ